MNRIEVICTDLDGIINDLELFQDWMIEDYYTSRGEPVPEVKNPTAYDIKDIYELSKIKRQLIWIQYFPYYSKYFGPRSDVFEVLKYWQAKGKKVYVPTARAFVTNFFLGKMSRNWVETWFQENEFKPDDIAWISEKNAPIEKVEAFKVLKADFGLDDQPKVIDPLLDICDIGTINTNNNSEYCPNNKTFAFYRHDDWLQIKDTVDKIDKGRSMKYVKQ